MILVDMNQITIASIMAESKGKPVITEELVRHIVLNVIRSLKNKFGQNYGKLVLCYDSGPSWRHQVFDHYKAHRKADREAQSTVDWTHLFSILNKIQGELQSNFVYPVVSANQAEGDDAIAVLTKKFHNEEKILIVSSDTDFLQLQKYPNVEQYSFSQKQMIVSQNPEYDLHEHIMRGDPGDGIPNYLSDSDTFVAEEKRQKRLTKKKIDDTYQMNYKIFCDTADEKTNYMRNNILINFDFIPAEVEENIITAYNSQLNKDSNVFNYLVAHKMKLLLEHASEF